MNRLELLKLLASLGSNLPQVISLGQEAYNAQMIVIDRVQQIVALVKPAGSMPPQAFTESPALAQFDPDEQIAVEEVMEVYEQHRGYGDPQQMGAMDGSRIAKVIAFMAAHPALMQALLALLAL